MSHRRVLALSCRRKGDAWLPRRAVVPGAGTLLHVAARRGRLNTVRRLISIGANVDAVDAAGLTPLAGAAWAGQEHAVIALLYAAEPHTMPGL